MQDFILACRQRGNSPSTIALKLTWVKAWLNWCIGRGRLGRKREAFARRMIISFYPDEISPVIQPKRQRRVADLERVKRLLESIDMETFDGLRFHAQVLLMLNTGHESQ